MDIKPTDAYFIGEENPWDDAAPGIKRQIMGYDKHIMLVKVKFEVGGPRFQHRSTRPPPTARLAAHSTAYVVPTTL